MFISKKYKFIPFFMSASLMISISLYASDIKFIMEEQPEHYQMHMRNLESHNYNIITSKIDVVNFNRTQGFSIHGAAGDSAGFSVSGAGDINADGIQDIIIGAPYSSSSYVIYGKRGGYPASINLAILNSIDGFQINGEKPGDWTGISVSGAGDINADGIQDIIIGAPKTASSVGSSYVIYGKKGGYADPIDLTRLNNTYGFQINGEKSGDLLGTSVSGAGDINADGIQDIIVANSPGNAGSSYVIYGKKGGYLTPINLASLNNTYGFQINGAARYGAIWSVSGAGDINADGIQDIIIGANSVGNAGSSYVIYGKKGGYLTPINLTSLNSTYGFQINGAPQSDFFSYSVSGAGDINADGIQDIIIGIGANSVGNAGSSYVIYGKKGGYLTSINLSSLKSTDGFQINGITGTSSGYSVSGAGDINADGIQDIIIGAPDAPDSSGSSYVIYGKKGGYFFISLSNLKNTDGFQINGIANGRLGTSVSDAGDINDDGIQDIIIGAPYAPDASGTSYVIYGKKGGYSGPINLGKQGVVAKLKDSVINKDEKIDTNAAEKVVMAPSYAANEARTDYAIYDSNIQSPVTSNANAFQIPWYSPAKWLSSLKDWWYTQESIDTSLPYVKEMLDIKAQINQASKLSSDRWFQFSLEDLTEDMNLILKNPHVIEKDTIKNMEKRLRGIQNDFLYEQVPNLSNPFNDLFADQAHLLPLKEPMVALNPGLASLNYQGFAPLMLAK